MKITQRQRITIAKKKIRGIDLTAEELEMDKYLTRNSWIDFPVEKVEEVKKGSLTMLKPVRKKRHTRKEKALYAIEKRAESLDNPKWMQKPIDYTDKSIPLGKRRVAYVRYLTHKGKSLAEAKYESVKWIH